ncbi:hypothetical protein N7501_011781 [Penicillium viridicatum]|nr:hypothetical protein N7501_011781 [Penicillium viridicatum]
MPIRSAKSVVEIAAGQNAIKRWILTEGWQRASYMHEPGRGPAGKMMLNLLPIPSMGNDELEQLSQLRERRLVQESGYMPMDCLIFGTLSTS